MARPVVSRQMRRSPDERSQSPGRNAAHCPGWPLQRQGHPKIVSKNASQKRSSGPTLDPGASTSPAGLTARARPEARPGNARGEPLIDGSAQSVHSPDASRKIQVNASKRHASLTPKRQSIASLGRVASFEQSGAVGSFLGEFLLPVARPGWPAVRLRGRAAASRELALNAKASLGGKVLEPQHQSPPEEDQERRRRFTFAIVRGIAQAIAREALEILLREVWYRGPWY
jgi:hypothetical protein